MDTLSHSTTAPVRVRVDTKTQEAIERLTAMAHREGPGAKLPTVRQLCKDLAVSNSTLSQALAELENRAIIRRRQGSGIFVSPLLHQRRLCLLCSPEILLESASSPFWRLLVDEIRTRGRRKGEALSLHFTRPEVRLPHPEPHSDSTALTDDLAQSIAAGRFDGVIALELTHALTRWIEGHNVPVVAYAGPASYIVGVSDLHVIQCGVTELARRGRRRPVLLCPSGGNNRRDQRLTEAFRAAAASAGMDTEMLRLGPWQRDEDFDPRIGQSRTGQGYLAARRWFGAQIPERERPDALVSTDDMLTQGALMALQQLNLQAGVDLDIATHANAGSPALLAWQDRLIRLEIDPAEIVSTMFGVLDALMAGGTPDGTDPAPLDDRYPDYRPPERIIWIRPRLVPAAER